LYLPFACFVLFAWMVIFPRPALGQAAAQPRDTPSSAIPSPGADAAPSGPIPRAPPTAGYGELSTGVHVLPGADATPSPGPAPAHALDLRDRRYADAHVDRVLLVPTAETHPQGTFYFSSYEVVLLQAGYAVSDRTQITLTSMPPLPREQILPLDLSLKTVLVRAPAFRVAALGSVSGIAGLEEGAGLIGRVGGVVQLCLERTCRSSVSVGTNVALAGPAIIAGTGAGVILRATRMLSILFEVDSVIPLGTAINQVNGLIAAPGIRLSGEHLGLDLAFARRLDVLDGVAIPFIAATYRTGS
jgi:hypothetical protein